MSRIERIPVDLIHPNPYQPRTSEDAEHIAALAEDIRARGLLQAPAGRLIDAGRHSVSVDAVTSFAAAGNLYVQLAFGHSRLAAFKLLASQGLAEFEVMPVSLADFDDAGLFEAAMSENLKRRDLTPVEVAQAMVRYRKEFGKTSVEIGALFGMSDGAARQKMRLAELPEAAAQALASGAMTEVEARQILTLQRVNPEVAARAVAEVARMETGEPIERVIKHQAESAMLKMHESWKSGPPLAGNNLWSLSWTPPGPFDYYELAVVIKRCWKGEKTFKRSRVRILGMPNESMSVDQLLVTYWQNRVHRSELNLEDYEIAYPGCTPLLELCIHFTEPPACTACPFYARMDGTHYCGMKPCHSERQRQWQDAELKRLSKETGIRAYNKAQDGEQVIKCPEKWGNRPVFEAMKKAYESKASWLRLTPSKGGYSNNPLTNHPLIGVIAVGADDGLKALAKVAQEEEAKEKESRKDSDAAYKLAAAKVQASDAFLEEVACQIFATALRPLAAGLVMDLAGTFIGRWGNGYEGPLASDEIGNARLRLMYSLLNGMVSGEINREGPGAVAKHLVGVALTYGLELPSDWYDLAAKYEVKG